VNTFGLAGFLWNFVKPGSRGRARAREATAKGYEGNLKGEGLVTGGVYVVRQGGTVEYARAEEEIGDTAPIDEVVAAVERAAAQAGTDTEAGRAADAS